MAGLREGGAAPGGAVLLARNGRGEWELPGGRIDPGETPEGAMIREVGEETGLQVVSTGLLGLRPFDVLPEQFVLLVGFSCAEDGRRDPRVSSEHEALAWWRIDALDGLELPSVYRDFVSLATRGRIVLLGDSHLAGFDRSRLHRLRTAAGATRSIVNSAFGGASAVDLQAQLQVSPILPTDVFVVSIGTNDYAPWKRVPLERFETAVSDVLNRLAHHPVIVLRPPGVDEAVQRRSRPTRVRTEGHRRPYAESLHRIALHHGARVIDPPPADGASTGSDGVHLGERGYDLLIERLATALRELGVE